MKGALGTAAAISLALLALSVFGAPVPQLIFGHDLIFLLDGAYKWNAGFRPHVDYYSPLGFLAIALVAWGKTIAGNFSQAMPTAQCLFTVALLPAVLYTTFSRLRPWLAMATTVMFVATALAAHQLKFESSALTYCTIYNRWGYVLFCLALLTIVFPPQPRRWNLELTDGVIASSCILLAAALKITFGILALLLFFSWILIQPRARAFYTGAFCAALVWLVMFGYILEWRGDQFVADMALAFQARKGLDVKQALESARYLYPDICLVAALALLRFWSGLPRLRLAAWVEGLRILLTLSCFVLAAAAIVMSNAPNGSVRESPVLSLGALIFLGGILNDLRRSSLPAGAALPASFPASSSTLLGFLLFLVVFGAGKGWTSTGLANPMVLAMGTGLWWVAQRAQIKLARSSTAWIRSLACAAAVLVVAPVTARNINSLFEAAKFKLGRESLPSDQVFGAGGLAGIQIRAFGGELPSATTYLGKIEEGLELLEATGHADKTVHALEFANPFNMARMVSPSRRGVTCWQIGFVYSFAVAPPPERVFSPEELVMLPKRFGDGYQENIQALLHHYGCYLEENYHPPLESHQWYLYVPKASPAAGPRSSPRLHHTAVAR